MTEHKLPADIERTSLSIITKELEALGIALEPENAPVVKRVIHTTADFDYAKNLYLSSGAAALGASALAKGTPIITDTNMARAGVSKPGLAKCGGEVLCFMAEPEVAEAAKLAGTTRAVAAVKKAAALYPTGIFAVGNAPTALLALCEEMENNPDFRPALIVGVPVGFVNVVESKELLVKTCRKLSVPVIAAMGRKGGSNVAGAICNALIYTAADMLDPTNRGWQG